MGDRPQSVVTMVGLQSFAQAHLIELVNGPGSETIATGLLAGKDLLLHDHDVQTCARGPVCSGTTCRATTYHE